MRVEDRRSLELNRAAIKRLAGDWDRYVPRARANIETMRRAGSCASRYLNRWEDLLTAGLDDVRRVALAETDEGQLSRSVHPFAGRLTLAERTEIILATRA